MSFTLYGIPVSRGIVIGHAYLFAPAVLDVPHYLVEQDQIEEESARFRLAQHTVQQELDTLKAELPDDAPGEMEAFLDVHSLILNDDLLVDAVIQLIRTRRYNAEWALATQLEVLVARFEDIEDEYLRERRADIEQVTERVLKVLAGVPGIRNIIAKRPSDNMILVARDIAPADMLQLKNQAFRGFVTDLGGKTSHTAIVARSLGIPAAVGVTQASLLIKQDDLIIIDGDAGIVIVDPTLIVLEEYRDRQRECAIDERRLQCLKHAPVVTVDGTPISLLANIELPSDARTAVSAGALGVGLFRTEFLFMDRCMPPGEEAQFEAYRRVVQEMDGLPLTIRTIDIGADKPLNGHDAYESAKNPALGLRAIRWSLSEPRMFLVQLRAILRASAFGPVRILFPMLMHVQEIDQTLDLVSEAKRQLDLTGFSYDLNVKLGAMIEVPAAVLALPIFLKRFDFLSIGTNDLIQYTLAIDRANNEVAHLYDPFHPAVLRLIAMTIREANTFGVPVAVCGEIAGDPSAARILLGMGLREFSMHPSQLLQVKREILRVNLPDLELPLQDLLAATEPKEMQAVLARLGTASR
ncbi:phosphoenolpyruvate--protein phosphotransferase [Candidatus Pandoraea novymonadis]|uniref:Phosphoenolpyruvate-protein phosphotransferase n=1 Tax=Candidatus Pandoraea novymonadis TaxID=1808959 RepID=A0ABX5FFD0_9BURK|nr:phosphoenolpyruvate--protein phosphotransferase [Candidatus Pandoraea novymonadis]PSB91742.1 Phosphoenolpyruvate-protein phosphotransferase [Candidatus Pandoraea novymonadis]